MNDTLPDELHAEISSLCEQGGDLAEVGNYNSALALYVRALNLVPQPNENWEASTWILAAIGDAHFLSGNYEIARDALSHAMACPGAIGNPFLHLRLGQSQLELGNEERAKEELARALILEGREIFAEEAPRYFAFITSHLKPPAGDESW